MVVIVVDVVLNLIIMIMMMILFITSMKSYGLTPLAVTASVLKTVDTNAPWQLRQYCQ
jgi:hypothetical protein